MAMQKTSSNDSQKNILASEATLRDFFAAQALGALIAAPKNIKVPGKVTTYEQGYARIAYIYADAMLAEREKNV